MSRGPLKFKQRDVTRAVKAVAAAGVEILRVDVDQTGRISIVAGNGVARAADPALERWLADED